MAYSPHHNPRRDTTISSTIGRWFRSPLRTGMCILGALALTVAVYWVQPPRFEARTDVVVVAIPSFSVQGTISDISMDSAVQLLTSDGVLGSTAKTLGYPGGPDALLDDLIISPIINSRILRLYVKNADPAMARDAVQALADELLRTRSDRLERSASARVGEINSRLAAIDAELTAISSEDDVSESRQNVTILLISERTALAAELAGIEALPTEAGFIARAAALPVDARRPYAPTFIGSGLALGLCTAWLIAPTTRARYQSPNYGETQ